MVGIVSGARNGIGVAANWAGDSAETKGAISVGGGLSSRGLSQILGKWDRLSSLSEQPGKAVLQIWDVWIASGAAETG